MRGYFAESNTRCVVKSYTTIIAVIVCVSTSVLLVVLLVLVLIVFLHIKQRKIKLENNIFPIKKEQHQIQINLKSKQ